MPAITAILHTFNDALRLGRCLETVYPCEQILIIDHGSSDDTLHVARDYGAQVVSAPREPGTALVRQAVHCAWILCLDPRESVSESLAASLYEWRLDRGRNVPGIYSLRVRQETPNGWHENAVPEARLVPADWDHWAGHLPAPNGPTTTLAGPLLRFALP